MLCFLQILEDEIIIKGNLAKSKIKQFGLEVLLESRQ